RPRASVKAAIQQRARELGFDACAFTTAIPPEHSAAFTRWINAKHNGEMAWLERNAHKRVDPQLVLANAKTIVTLAVNYAGKTGNVRGEKEETHSTAQQSSGVVARYAQFTDYHDLVAEPLKQLAKF